MPGDPFFAKWLAIGALLGCPVGGPTSGDFAYQPFLGGYMLDDLRNPSAKVVTVLFNDGTYRSYPDPFVDGQPDDACPAIPAGPGLIKPIRGFNRIWCNYVDVRTRLPGGTASEIGLTLVIQQFNQGQMWGNVPSPLGVIALLNGGIWK